MNFIQQFERYIGKTECPVEYLRWAAISLVAACLGDRVWMEKPLGSRSLKVAPNLYVLLLGPSGNWKSFATNAALGLLRQAMLPNSINLYQGKITSAALYDAMFPGVPNTEYYHPENSRIYIVNDELSNDFGDSDAADTMLRALTELYTPDKPFSDSTRWHGKITLTDYVVNWEACTTEEWLLDRVNVNMLEGGLFGRLCIAEAGYAPQRIFEDDQAAPSSVSESELLGYVEYFLRLKGEFKRSEAAREYERQWFYSREVPPQGDPLRGIWQREPSLMNKLEIVAAAASGSNGIELKHAETAVAWLPSSSAVVARLAVQSDRRINAAMERAARSLLSLIERHRIMPHWKLAKAAYDRRIMADQLRRIVETWIDSGLISRENAGSTKLGGITYRWEGRRE